MSKARNKTAKTPDDPDVLNDAGLCRMLGISVSTLRRHLREGPSKKMRKAPASGDIRLLRHAVVSGTRLWSRAKVREFIEGRTP